MYRECYSGSQYTDAGHSVVEGAPIFAWRYIFATRYTAETIESHPCSRLPLTATDCSEACSCDPVGSPVGSYTEYTVLDSGVIYPVLLGDAFPFAVNSTEPDVVNLGYPVIMNVKLADFWGNSRRWGCDIDCGRSEVPGGNLRRAGAERPMLFEWGWCRRRIGSGAGGIRAGSWFRVYLWYGNGRSASSRISWEPLFE
jgi:hypothetical protein